MLETITEFYPFWKSILSSFPSELLTYFLHLLTVFIIVVWIRLFINWL